MVFTCSWSGFRNETGQGDANIVAYETPTDAENTHTVFSRRFSTKNGTAYNSSPVLTANRIYVVNEDILYELDRVGTILRQLTLSAGMDSVCQMIRQGDFLYIPLTGGRVECVRISDMESVFCSAPLGGQSLATLFYREGYLYTGTTTMTNVTDSTGLFYCLDATDGDIVWTYEDDSPGGYYWSGAMAYGDALFFAGDNGKLISHSLLTDEVYDMYQLSSGGKIRSALTYDADTDCLYTAGNDGILYRIRADRSGQILQVTQAEIVPGASFINCTSTPTIYRGRIYLGCIADTEGYLCVLDADDLSLIYKADTGQYREVKSSPLLSTAYGEDLVLYFTCNALPGGIYTLTDRPGATAGKAETLYTPASKQYCLSSIAAGEDGTLYYSNDSGTFFAVGKGVEETEAISPPAATDAAKAPASAHPAHTAEPVQNTSEPAGSPKKKVKKVSVTAPKSFTARKKKKCWRFSWKTKSRQYQTLLYTRTGSQKWKKRNLKKKTTYKAAIGSATKKMRVRLRCRLKKNGKWYDSPYTKILTVRI